MSRSARNLRRTRAITFEPLQPRELMVFDAMPLFPVPELNPVAGQLWADRILSSNENSISVQRDKPLDLMKFATEAHAKKFLTDALLKTWSDVLGKPVNNQLPNSYGQGPSFWLYPDTASDSLAGSNTTSHIAPELNPTNNQVTSVDEGDRFEVSGGGFVYALANNQDGSESQVSVFDARDPRDLKKVSKINVSGINTQMHLVDNQLVLVSSDAHVNMPHAKTKVQVFDVADPSTPKLQTSLEITGSSQQSRFAAGKLTLYGNSYIRALRPLFITETPNATYSHLTETPIGRFETAEEFAARIQPLVVGWMLPDVKVDGSDVDLNNSDWNDLIASEDSNFRNQVSVLSFALNSDGLELIDTEVLIGATMQESFVDSNTIYITNELYPWNSGDGQFLSRLSQTEIFAIEFDSEAVAYVASGVVPGTILDSRMMDEFEGNLRVFSESREWVGETASTNLYILKPHAGKMEISGLLADVADGQALYSAYFDEDQAFIATWIVGQVGSLHGFDLSDPTNPREISELEVPGVSTYLQRVDENHLIGVGFVDVGVQDWRQQVSLYDVSDLTSFNVVATWTSDTKMSPNIRGAGYDALALNFDSNTGLLSIALPAFHPNFNLANTDNANRNALTVLKIETGESASITEVGQVGDSRAMAQRSAIVDDALPLSSNAWLHFYSVDDPNNELDRELMVHPGVADWFGVSKGETVEIAVLANDFVTGGRITAISDSNIGGTVTVLDGTTIQYTAPNQIENYAYGDPLTYTVSLENGESYTAELYVEVYPDSQPTTEVTEFAPEEIETGATPTERTNKATYDINGDGEVSPIDALLVIEYLIERSLHLKEGEPEAGLSASDSVMDTSGDGEISPIDVLLIIDLLIANAALQTGGEAADSPLSNSAIESPQAKDAAIMAILATDINSPEEDLRRNRKSRLI